MYPTSVLRRKGHRINAALAGADASLFEFTAGAFLDTDVHGTLACRAQFLVAERR